MLSRSNDPISSRIERLRQLKPSWAVSFNTDEGYIYATLCIYNHDLVQGEKFSTRNLVDIQREPLRSMNGAMLLWLDEKIALAKSSMM